MSIYRCAHCGGINRIISAPPGGKRPICGRCKRPLDLSGKPHDVSAKELRRAISIAPVPVLVDFWAPWCSPCKMVAPVIEQLGHDRAGDLLVLKLNSDEFPEASAAHHVSGIPTMILFREGAEVKRQTGALGRSHLEHWLGSALGQSAQPTG